MANYQPEPKFYFFVNGKGSSTLRVSVRDNENIDERGRCDTMCVIMR